MIYLASPYSHPDETIRRLRFSAAQQFSINLTKKGIVNFCPIAYGHQYALAGCPGDATYWEEFNYTILRACAAIWVLEMPGTAESKGVAAEVAEAKKHGLPCTYVALSTASIQGLLDAHS